MTGRSLARGVPAPEADRGGYRVDTGSDSEHCRWVFAAPSSNLSALAREINQPGWLIKLCGKDEMLRRLLPDGWHLHAPAFFMQSGTWPAARALPAGYRCETSVVGSVAHVAVFCDDGDMAASGYAAETGTAFVFDRIVTAPAHRRRGLGAGVMAALRATRTRPDIPELLVATDEGRYLYQRLGWRVLSPYATAEFAA
ncbi:GNAT family N-acetyltransferase [Sphingomonas sp. 22176]|uniref:GNAT family N-acetyltransferase n=1 Tax=Sphingomonas sp. 22176 TaxID=3453884 RepID=UPI003F86A29F